MGDTKKFYDVEEIAEMFGVSKRTVQRWCEELGMPHMKLIRTVRFDMQEVLRWAKDFERGGE